MRVYSYSEARQQLASVLNRARREGEVRIRRRDGEVFAVRPAEGERDSPLDVPGVSVRITTDDIVTAVRESRRSTRRFVRASLRKIAAPRGPRKRTGSRRAR
jgi:prevent-host-death family protein